MNTASAHAAVNWNGAAPERQLPELGDTYEPMEPAGHDLPWRPMEDVDDFDTWAERVLNAGGFGAAALDID